MGPDTTVDSQNVEQMKVRIPLQSFLLKKLEKSSPKSECYPGKL